MFKKIALLLAAVLCISCLFTGMAMAADTSAAGESGGGDITSMITSMIGSMTESSGTEGEDAEAAGTETDGESSGEEITALITSLISSMGDSSGAETSETDADTQVAAADDDSAAESADSESADAESAGAETAAETTDTEGESSGDFMTILMSMFGIDFDFEAFYAELDERVANGEELTVEDVYPQAYWDFMNMMMNMSSDGESEEAPYVIEIGAKGNEMYYIWTFTEVISEEDAQQVIDSVKESFESDDTKANLKESMEEMSSSYNIDINEIKETLIFINGDGSVIYEKTYTYEELAEELAEKEAEEEAEIEEAIEELKAALEQAIGEAEADAE